MFIVMAGKELIRKKMMLVICLISFLFVALYTFGLWELSRLGAMEGSLAQQLMNAMVFFFLGLFFSQLMVAFFVFFAAMGTVSGEIESGLLYAILARPLPRWRIYWGKFTGFAVWSMVYAGILFWLMYAAIFWQFHTQIGTGWLFKAFLLFELIPLLLLAVTMLGSTFLPSLGNGAACALLFCLALFGGFAEAIMGIGGKFPGGERFSFLISLLIPTDTVFRRMLYELAGPFRGLLGKDLLNSLGPLAVPSPPSAVSIGYAVLYLLVVFGWGARRFSRKDIM